MIVLDTNVVSELMRPRPAAAVRGWVRQQEAAELFTTSITLAEIGYGIVRLPAGHRRDELAAAADQVFSAFPEQVLPFDAQAASHYGPIIERRTRAGAPIEGFDAQIASICRVRNATLATRNVHDFTGTGVVVVDPWDGPA